MSLRAAKTQTTARAKLQSNALASSRERLLTRSAWVWGIHLHWFAMLRRASLGRLLPRLRGSGFLLVSRLRVGDPAQRHHQALGAGRVTHRLLVGDELLAVQRQQVLVE